MTLSLFLPIHAPPFQSNRTHTHLNSQFLKSSDTDHLNPTREAFNRRFFYLNKNARTRKLTSPSVKTRASLLETPVLWVGRLFIFYALLKVGAAGSKANPLVSDIYGGDDGGSDVGRADDGGHDDLGFSKWLDNLRGRRGGEAALRRKLVRKWRPTIHGTLKRNHRVASKSEGHRLLKAIASLLSDDDHFRDASSHKGCQIRRESAHGESVCCNNVRALFDELPTPHLVVEITAFPAGPLTRKDYDKAEKLERILRSAPLL